MLDAILAQLRDTSVIMGVIALVGLLLQKKSAVDVFSGTVKTIIGFTGDLVITMSDLTDELNADERVPSAIGITNIVDKAEMKQKLEAWLAEHAE